MTIGIDGNEANVSQRTGVQQYAFEILWAIYKLEDIKNQDLKFTIYLKNAPLSDLPPKTNNWEYQIIEGGRLWVLTKLMPRLLGVNKPDV